MRGGSIEKTYTRIATFMDTVGDNFPEFDPTFDQVRVKAREMGLVGVAERRGQVSAVKRVW